MSTAELQLLTGGEAVAQAMRQIDPDVVPVYPITPQTPIIQGFARLVADGQAHTELVDVESEHSALSAAIGAALAGARTMTATSSQGLALMTEVVYIAAAMRAPIVIAPRLAEHPDVLLPVLVCQDGFTITHSAEPVALLGDEQVAGFLGEYEIPHPLLDPAQPTTQGPFAMPDYYFELRRQQIAALEAVPTVFAGLAAEFEELSGRRYGALEGYRLDGATRVMVALGSSAGTIKDVVDELRGEGKPVGLIEITSFRPFPAQTAAALLEGAETVIVLDRSASPGGAAPLLAEVVTALRAQGVEVEGHVYGLGGRDLHPEDVRKLFAGRAGPYVGLRGEACPA